MTAPDPEMRPLAVGHTLEVSQLGCAAGVGAATAMGRPGASPSPLSGHWPEIVETALSLVLGSGVAFFGGIKSAMARSFS